MSTTDTAAPIGMLDLAAERASLGSALGESLLRVLDSGHYVLGPEVEALERSFAELCGVRFATGVGSGTDALVLALLAAGVGPCDGVVTSPFTFFASAGTVAWIGARPLLADIDPTTGLIDPAAVRRVVEAERAAGRPVKAILPVHLYGQLADMDALRAIADEHGLALIEDGAQCHGARRDGYAAGERGTACTFSFYPTKNLGAAGEGGLVVTDDERVHAALRLLRDHGSSAKYRHARVGTNSRLQAMQAAVLNVKLPHLAAWNARRREVAARYDAAFAGAANVAPLATVGEAVYHQYAVRIGDAVPGGRDAVQAALGARKIGAAIHYPMCVHEQEAAADWGYATGSLPHAEDLAGRVLCLPIHPFLTDGDADRVAAAVLDATP